MTASAKRVAEMIVAPSQRSSYVTERLFASLERSDDLEERWTIHASAGDELRSGRVKLIVAHELYHRIDRF
jgi:hypothetical protein